MLKFNHGANDKFLFWRSFDTLNFSSAELEKNAHILKWSTWINWLAVCNTNYCAVLKDAVLCLASIFLISVQGTGLLPSRGGAYASSLRNCGTLAFCSQAQKISNCNDNLCILSRISELSPQLSVWCWTQGAWAWQSSKRAMHGKWVFLSKARWWRSHFLLQKQPGVFWNHSQESRNHLGFGWCYSW